uniref:Uncharacterized protein n=1 Tax=Hyaloperonospora arabidopsidis (strain Emoy2) TaxID=559515 RepID=M4BVA0_HYAAE
MLQSPPGFLVCTHLRTTRVVVLGFFEAFLEVQVIAIVPPHVRMPQYVAEKTLLIQLLERSAGKTESNVMRVELVKCAKRTSYDADTRRLIFIMPDHAAAASWHAKTILFRGKRLQLLCAATMERDDITSPSLPATSAGRHQLQYQVRVLVNGVAARTIQAILASSVSCAVRSVSRGCSHGSEVYDSNFFVATFDTESCPEQLKLVTHIATSGTERVPCFTCYSPYHSSAKCSGRNGDFQVQHHREFTGMPIAPPHVS